MNKVRIGVMGCASIAEKSVIPAIKSLSKLFELVAVSSRNAAKSANFAKQFDCEAITGYDELLRRTDIDAIYMPLPTGLHKEWIIKAMNAGKHVYAEKSISMNAHDAKAMVNLAKTNGLALMEGYMFQYHSQHQQVKELLREGKIGDIRSFSASFGFPPLPPDNFRYNKNIGGGALMDCAGYVVRAAYFLIGSDIEVKAASMHYKNSSSLYGNAYMNRGDGVGIHLSFGFDNFYQCNYKIWGSKGMITMKKAFTPKSNESPQMILEENEGTQIINLEPDNHFIGAFKEFYSVINGTEDLREKHYAAIIEQSLSLDLIKKFAIENI